MDTEHTQGSLTKEAIRLAWPAVCESFFIALAGMVDTFMVSTLGANAVAAVGLTTQPKFLGLALFIAANVAISALDSRIRLLNSADRVRTRMPWRRDTTGSSWVA